MDELNKIPPVTRSVLGAVLLVTIPCLLEMMTPYPFVLYWPFITKRWEVYRLITCFLYAGKGIGLLFDLFFFFRNSTDLEGNTFFRRTSKYAWALFIMAAEIIALNYPLQTPILWKPFLNSLTYIWAKSNPHAVVSLFGFVQCPAKWLPYAYLGLDLIMGGPSYAIQSATGLLAGHGYWLLAERDEAGRGRRWTEPPALLQRILPDSVDPAVGPGPTPTGGAGRATSFGQAFAPRGTNFGQTVGGTTPSRTTGTTGTTTTVDGSRTGWLGNLVPRFGSRRTTSTSSGPSREDMLAAAERRLRSQAANSIIGRHRQSAAPSASSAASTSTGGVATSSSIAAGRDSAASSVQRGAGPSEAVRRVGASSADASGSTTGSKRGLTFGELAAREEKAKASGTQEDASGSGGRVAEQRRDTVPPPNPSSNAGGLFGFGSKSGQDAQGQQDGNSKWPGSGRPLGE